MPLRRTAFKTLMTLLATLIFCGQAAHADTVYLKNGRKMSGYIVRQNDEGLWINVGAGELGFKTAQIERVEKSDKTTAWLTGSSGHQMALDKQKASGEPFVLYFSANWCGYCRLFQKDVLDTQRVGDALQNVVKVRVNVDADKSLAGEYGVQGIPFLTVVSKGGNKRINTGGSVDDFLRQCREAGLKV